MAFDLYFAGSQCPESTDLIEQNGYCRLHSYYGDKTAIKRRFERNPEGKLFIDSGAFTAWTRGAKIDVDEYISWLNENKERIYLAGQVDVIAGERNRRATLEEQAEASRLTWENYLYMRERLDNPDVVVYTFHIGEDFKWLKQALAWKDPKTGKGFPYMALGGTVGKPMPDKINWFRKVFQIVEKSDNPNVKIHAFGMTSLRVLKMFPFASADSTGWIMTGSNGGIMTKIGVIQISENSKSDPNYVGNLPDEQKQYVRNIVEQFGYTMEQLASDYKFRVCYNLKYLQDWAEHYEYKPLPKRNTLF